MKLRCLFAALHFLLFQFLLSKTVADLNTDKQALLDFATAVPHGRKLNWDSATSICSVWDGVTCNLNGTRVLTLRLPGIGLFGPIPANTIGKLDALKILSFRSNFLNGNLPSDVLSLPSLHYMYLQRNNFSGIIPSSLSPNLRLLDISFNSLTGVIPSAIENLTYLNGLNLQNNSLTGPIPDLNLPNLNRLNLSYNNLNGTIPISLQKFSPSSFEGNFMLCGPPLNQCSLITPMPSPSPSHLPTPATPPQKEGKDHKLSSSTVIAIAVGACALFLVFILVMVFCCLKKKNSKIGESVSKVRALGVGAIESAPDEEFQNGPQESENNKLVFFRECPYRFDLEDLLRASAEVLGKCSYGTAYKATLEEGLTVLVKRLKDVIVGKRDFDQHMEKVGRIGPHPNIVPVRAYYYSKDEKLLVYDYMKVRSLSTLLHVNRDIGRTSLNWETRKRICQDTARGIAYMHSAGPGKFIHGNIKSSNVLLTEHFDGLTSDFGITPVMNPRNVPSNSTGYIAPEVMENKKYTQMSDVYSFGILLLEILTGKAPVRSRGRGDEVVDLPRWVQSVVREEWTSEVFDVELMKCADVEEEMVQLLQIAINCVVNVPDNRPKMQEVVGMIEEIRSLDSDDHPS